MLVRFVFSRIFSWRVCASVRPARTHTYDHSRGRRRAVQRRRRLGRVRAEQRIRLSVGRQARVDIQLAVGGQSEAVTVTADASMVLVGPGVKGLPSTGFGTTQFLLNRLNASCSIAGCTGAVVNRDGAADFGRITGTRPGRYIQFGARVLF
jgi:hypothetical protein